MKVFAILAVVVLFTLGVVGCGRDEPEPAPEAQPQVNAETETRFNTLVEQVTEHIRKGEYDGAETGLRELEKMSASLPEAMQQQVATTRAALTAARSTGQPTPTPPPQAE